MIKYVNARNLSVAAIENINDQRWHEKERDVYSLIGLMVSCAGNVNGN